VAIIDGETMIGVCGRIAILFGAGWILWFAPGQAMTQPLDTMPEAAPATTFRKAPAPEVLPVDTGRARPGAGIKEIVIDSAGILPDSVVPQTGHVPALPGENRLFSLFDYGKIVAIGPSLSYFYYNEHIDINPLIRDFRDQFMVQPAIIGTAKSSEYGTVYGFNLSVARSIRKIHLFLHSKFGMLFGIANTYDGSSPAYADTSGGPFITFSPRKDQKNNLFLMGGCDLGYAFPAMKNPVAVYSGIGAKVWYRDMTMYSQQSSSTSSELYYWFSVPLGAVVTKPVSPHLLIGVEPRVDLMFYGKMQASTSGYGSTINYPALTLGNRASYRLDAFVQTRPGESVSFRFGPYVMLYGFAQSNTDTVTRVPYGGGYPAQQAAFYKPASASFWIGFLFQVAFLRNGFIEENGR
jgi:hypothetical protein